MTLAPRLLQFANRTLGLKGLADPENAGALRWGIFWAFAALALRLFFWAYTHRDWEDALITVLHSENWVAGLGLTHFEEAIRIDRYSAPAYAALAGVLVEQDRIEQAIDVYARGMKEFGGAWPLPGSLPALLEDQGQSDDARRVCEFQIRGNPADAGLRLEFGNLLARQGRLEEAAGQFREILRLDPGNRDVWFNLASVLEAAKKNEEAAEAYRKVLQLDPRDTGAQEGVRRTTSFPSP